MAADLHLHTRASDGSFTPETVVEKADQLGFKYISITDHDTIAGVKSAQNHSQDKGIEVLTGVEINTEFKGEDVHLLGYLFDPEDDSITGMMESISKSRIERAKKIISRLKDAGYPVSFAELEDYVPGEIYTRSHIAEMLSQKGLADSYEAAFEQYLGRGNDFYIGRDYITAARAIESIKAGGGVSVLAHPGKLENQNRIIEGLRNFELEGLEVYYPDHSSRTNLNLLQKADKHDMLITGGSDFHGHDKRSSNQLGTIKLADHHVEKLKNFALRKC